VIEVFADQVVEDCRHLDRETFEGDVDSAVDLADLVDPHRNEA